MANDEEKPVSLERPESIRGFTDIYTPDPQKKDNRSALKKFHDVVDEGYDGIEGFEIDDFKYMNDILDRQEERITKEADKRVTKAPLSAKDCRNPDREQVKTDYDLTDTAILGTENNAVIGTLASLRITDTDSSLNDHYETDRNAVDNDAKIIRAKMNLAVDKAIDERCAEITAPPGGKKPGGRNRGKS